MLQGAPTGQVIKVKLPCFTGKSLLYLRNPFFTSAYFSLNYSIGFTLFSHKFRVCVTYKVVSSSECMDLNKRFTALSMKTFQQFTQVSIDSIQQEENKTFLMDFRFAFPKLPWTNLISHCFSVKHARNSVQLQALYFWYVALRSTFLCLCSSYMWLCKASLCLCCNKRNKLIVMSCVVLEMLQSEKKIVMERFRLSIFHTRFDLP